MTCCALSSSLTILLVAHPVLVYGADVEKNSSQCTVFGLLASLEAPPARLEEKFFISEMDK